MTCSALTLHYCMHANTTVPHLHIGSSVVIYYYYLLLSYQSNILLLLVLVTVYSNIIMTFELLCKLRSSMGVVQCIGVLHGRPEIVQCTGSEN